MDAAWKAGANRCLAKDHFEPKHVLNIVRETLSESQAAALEEEAALQLPTSPPSALLDGPEPGRGSSAVAATCSREPQRDGSARPNASLNSFPPDRSINAPAAGSSVELPGGEEDLMFQEEVRRALLKRAPQMAASLRSHVQSLLTSDDQSRVGDQLAELQSRVARMSQAFGMAGLPWISRFCDALSQLLGDLTEKPEFLKGSPLQTAAQAVARLEALFAQAPPVQTAPLNGNTAGWGWDETFRQDIRQAFLVRANSILAQLKSFAGEFTARKGGTRSTPEVPDLIRKIAFMTRTGTIAGCEAISRGAGILTTILNEFHTAVTDPVNGVSPRTITEGLGLVEHFVTSASSVNHDGGPSRIILVLHDNQPVCEALSSALHKSNFQSLSLNSLPRAMPLLEQHRFDLIFTGASLADSNATESSRKMPSAPANAATPVVFVTERRNFTERARIGSATSPDTISYPFLESELILKTLIYLTPEN